MKTLFAVIVLVVAGIYNAYAQRVKTLTFGSEAVEKYIRENIEGVSVTLWKHGQRAPYDNVMAGRDGITRNYDNPKRDYPFIKDDLYQAIEFVARRLLTEVCLNNGGLASVYELPEEGKLYHLWVDAQGGGSVLVLPRHARVYHTLQTFQFTKGPDGVWTYPEHAIALPPPGIFFFDTGVGDTIINGSWLSLPGAEEVRWVESRFDFIRDGSPATVSSISRNGAPESCWLVDLFGDNRFHIGGDELSGWWLMPEHFTIGTDVKQYVVLWYDEARTVGDEFSIPSGEWRPITASPVDVKKMGSGWLEVAERGLIPGQPYVIVSSDTVTYELTSLSHVGKQSVVTADNRGVATFQVSIEKGVTARFFRVLPADAGVQSKLQVLAGD